MWRGEVGRLPLDGDKNEVQNLRVGLGRDGWLGEPRSSGWVGWFCCSNVKELLGLKIYGQK